MHNYKLDATFRVNSRPAFSLLEVLMAVTLMGIVAAVVMPRLTSHSTEARIHACHVYRGNIEIQAELWFRNRGVWPADDLADIGTTSRYFPDGLPTCPVDNSGYTISANTGRVIAHSHDR